MVIKVLSYRKSHVHSCYYYYYYLFNRHEAAQYKLQLKTHFDTDTHTINTKHAITMTMDY